MSVFDWDDEDEFEDDEFEDEEFLDYLDEIGPVFNPMSGLFPIVDRIRQYTTQDDATTRMEISAVESYIERGIEACESYLAKHAAFDAYLAERGESA